MTTYLKRFPNLKQFQPNPAQKFWRILLLVSLLALPVADFASAQTTVSQWGKFEQALSSTKDYPNPIQDAQLSATFVSPTGRRIKAYGFWDGARVWRIRFKPSEMGQWSWQTTCSDASDQGLHQKSGSFMVGKPQQKTRFDTHGPVQVSHDGRYLVHADDTPFFFLADTAWNGALHSTKEDWSHYIQERARQKFTAVQWVTTQWRAAPKGDRLNRPAFEGRKPISINPEFFQRLDQKVEALNQAGLLSVPVMLWAIGGGSNPAINPGNSLPEDQAILLARYMVGRWHADDVVWILPGDADYRGEKAQRWIRIGRAVFGGIPHAPVSLHPGGMQWNWNEFKDESWLSLIGYQSGHGDNDATLRWMQEGPLTQDWMRLPHKPFINLEPPYENHIAYHSKKPHSDTSLRHAIYWSLLNAPPAGTSYGAHGVWGWDDGTRPPTDHAGSGTPLPWKEALKMPGAEQMAHLYDIFTSMDYYRLRPASIIVVKQPGNNDPAKYIAAAKSDQKDLVVVYIPEERTVEIKLDALPPSPKITWANPRTGETSAAVAVVTANTCQFPTPAEGDWLLIMKTEKKTDPDQP